MTDLEEKVMAFIEENDYLPGEFLYDLIDKLSPSECENLGKALASLIREGKLELRVRKHQFPYVISHLDS